MSQENELDWRLIYKVIDGTATKQELAKWEALSRQQSAYAALIPWLQRVQKEQQDSSSPFYAKDAWQDFKTRLPAQSIIPSRGIFRLWQKAGVAAAVAIIIGLTWWLSPGLRFSQKKVMASLVTYTVPNGQKKHLSLADSTEIWMNAGSVLKMPAEWGKDSVREVWLEGEGFFEAGKDPSRPFIVHTRHATVRVLGTSFNIEAYQQLSVAVTVVSGKVQFSGNDGQSVTLTQNQRSVLMNAAFQTIQTDASLYSVWREGILQFRDEPLLKVIGTLERRFNIPIKVVGTIDKDLYCTARFAADEPLDNILESLRHIYGLTISKKEGTIVIESK